jgi:hypothetical protein
MEKIRIFNPKPLVAPRRYVTAKIRKYAEKFWFIINISSRRKITPQMFESRNENTETWKAEAWKLERKCRNLKSGSVKVGMEIQKLEKQKRESWNEDAETWKAETWKAEA